MCNLGWREAIDEPAAGGAVGAHGRGVDQVAQFQVGQRLGVPRREGPAFAGNKVRESLFGLGPPDDIGRVVPFCGPLLLEIVPHVLEQ
jgi:hypothetical protein